MNTEIRVWPESDQIAQVVWSRGFEYRNREAILSMTRARFDQFDRADKTVSAGRFFIEYLLA
jgi:hypothetical protein